MQRAQRKRSAPSWLKEKPYIKVRFTQDGVTTKVTESCNIKLEESGKPLDESLANHSFRVGQVVWCYWKTANEKEKEYFEGSIYEMSDHSNNVDKSLQNKDDEVLVEDVDEDADAEIICPMKKKRVTNTASKKTAKSQVEKSTNSIDEEAKAAKRIANKEKSEEEKAKKEDNLEQSRELLNSSDEDMDMLFDFMRQIISRMDSIERKVDGNQQNLERLLKKIEKRKDHSLPVQVFVNKPDESKERPASPCLSQTSFNSSCSPPVLCSTPKARPSKATDKSDNSDECIITEDPQDIEEMDMDTNETESPQVQENDTAIIGDPKFGIKTDRECFDNIVKHSNSASALALNLMDNLIPKEIQRISNIRGTNGKSPLNATILAAIKGQLKRQYKWMDEELEKNWSGKCGIQQKMADKCRNLNKAGNKK